MYVGLTMFWSILAGNFGFGRFWPKKRKVVLVDVGRKKLVFDQTTGFGRYWPEKLDFDRENWCGSILAGKVVLVDFH